MPDADRPLNRRGEKAARRMGTEMARRGWRPDRILCSAAVRTRQTLERLHKGWHKAGTDALPDAHHEKWLYLATAETIRKHLRALDDETGSVLVIGHNPGLHDLAMTLSRDDDGADRVRLERQFPTCALAVIRFEKGGWRDIGRHSGQLTHLILPRELD